MSVVVHEPFPHSRMHPARRGALSMVLWAFGLATSLFLLGMWGRTVAVDTATIEQSTATVIDADIARDRVAVWLEDGLATVAATDSATAHAIAEAIQSRPEYAGAVDAIIGQFISGLFAAEGADSTVDIRQIVTPLVPIVVAEFAERDVPVDAGRVEDVLDAAAAIELDAGEAASIAAIINDARTFLTQVLVVALVAMVFFGAIAVYLVDRRFAMVRSLGTRVLIAAMSYALILRIASWALDPQRGRSSIAGGGSVLLGSNGQVFLILGAIAGAVAVAGGLFAWQRKQAPPAALVSEEDDTKEFATV